MTGVRIAIVGAGPAGMYAVGDLLDRLGGGVAIDVFERLATPWGLVRTGVAPDHPEKKRIADRLFDFALRDARVRFFGNIEVGSAVSHAEIASLYDGVIYAVGAGGDLPMGIAGEDLDGCVAARAFVAFYNGHPDFRDRRFDLGAERAVIVGNGNVALDVARILCTPVASLARTDISDAALHILKCSAVREVIVLGRRGPAEAAFSTPELEELGYLPDVDIRVEGADLPEVSAASIGWETRRKMEVLSRLASRPARGGKQIVFRFMASPVCVVGERGVEGLRIGINELTASVDGRLQAHPTGREEVIDTALIFRAIGYRGTRFPGLPFDEATGTIANVAGRVVQDDGTPLVRTYVTGWIKRGCRGIIGSNRVCARQTVDALMDDLTNGTAREPRSAEDPALALLDAGAAPVSHAGWLRIDRQERNSGRAQQRPRVKISDRDMLLSVAAAAPHHLTEAS